ncbi:MAG TPA: rhodanese-like domain-containing protein [Acidimicrobiia bacterium]|nr:rhodanese-like domain-containing protein [Acidimicrobiia bacterium]
MSMWQGQRIEEIGVVDADAGREHVVLLDVREAREWEGGHAPGATWIPMADVPNARFQLPINRRIACICRSGQRSARAASELVQMGFDAVNVTGGMRAWAAHGLPVVRDDGSPGEVV